MSSWLICTSPPPPNISSTICKLHVLHSKEQNQQCQHNNVRSYCSKNQIKTYVGDLKSNLNGSWQIARVRIFSGFFVSNISPGRHEADMHILVNQWHKHWHWWLFVSAIREQENYKGKILEFCKWFSGLYSSLILIFGTMLIDTLSFF